MSAAKPNVAAKPLSQSPANQIHWLFFLVNRLMRCLAPENVVTKPDINENDR